MRAVLERYFNRIWYRSEPPGLLWRGLAALHHRLLNGRWQRPRGCPPVPVIVVGNLSVGGGGKTPVVIALAAHYQAAGRRVAVISRGYGGRRWRQPQRVDPGADPDRYGDEPVLLARNLTLPVWVCVDRAAALTAAVTDGADLVIADDGLQHRRLARSFEICVIDGRRGLGNGWLLPAGPLRQPRTRLDQVDVVLGKGEVDGIDALVYRLETVALTRLDGSDPMPAAAWAGREVDGVCGIANPDGFFTTLAGLGMRVRPHPMPDHHHYTAADFRGLAGPIVVTAKDAVKLERMPLGQKLRVLSVRARLPDELCTRIDQHLLEFQA